MTKRSIGGRRLAVACVAALAAAVPLAATAHAGPGEPDVPGNIAVEDGHKLFLVGHAVGVQIYSCNATVSGFSWGLVAPRADLYDDSGKLIVTHFGGPTWQAKDGSKVVGQRVDQAPANNAIPWLLLSAASTTAGPDGDRLAHTTFIQRIATTGGVAPAAADCNSATAGVVREIPYTADYYFWKRSS